MAYYLKYRPQKISDLDNENVRDLLSSVLTAKESPHAFLLTGPKGLGKTSSARIIAKAINCESPDKNSPEPCGACDSCISITKGINIDVIEIDGASNRGIDEIRDLREKIRLAPSHAKKKVYIIDEVHMLTTEAFNALLKTLEEPPEHAVVLLATTEPYKVPETIVSRCVHISFHKATHKEIVHALKRIVAGENLKIDDETLLGIAELADGGFRDAAKILEEIVVLADGKIIDGRVLEKRFKTKTTSESSLKLLRFFGDKDRENGISFIVKLSDEGTDFALLLSRMISDLHKILLFQAGVEKDKRFEPYTAYFTPDDIAVLFALLSKATQQTKFAVVEELPIELALVRWTETDGVLHVEKKVTFEDDTEEELTLKTMRKKAGNIARQELASPGKDKKEKEKLPTAENHNLFAYKAEGELTDEWINEFWHEIINRMKQHNHTLAGVMRGCRIRSFDREALIIETKFAFHKERLSEAKTQQALEEVCAQITGKKILVSVELSGK